MHRFRLRTPRPCCTDLLRSGLAKEAGRRPADALAFLADLESTARFGYGEDWEKRGRGSLARRAALLAALWPLAGSVVGGSALATTVLGLLQTEDARRRVRDRDCRGRGQRGVVHRLHAAAGVRRWTGGHRHPDQHLPGDPYGFIEPVRIAHAASVNLADTTQDHQPATAPTTASAPTPARDQSHQHHRPDRHKRSGRPGDASGQDHWHRKDHDPCQVLRPAGHWPPTRRSTASKTTRSHCRARRHTT